LFLAVSCGLEHRKRGNEGFVTRKELGF
jgi:hypothetical protein